MDEKPIASEKCGNCGDEFTPNKYWQKFCTDRCRKDFHGDRRARATKLLLEEEAREREQD